MGELEPSRTLEPGWRHALRLWWSFTWRWPLLMLIPLLPIAVTVALIKPLPATTDRLVHLVTGPLLFWAQLMAFKQLLRIDYKGFSVRALERRPEGR